MEYLKLTRENLDREHICGAISNHDDPQVRSKKAWLKERLEQAQGAPTSFTYFITENL